MLGSEMHAVYVPTGWRQNDLLKHVHLKSQPRAVDVLFTPLCCLTRQEKGRKKDSGVRVQVSL